MEIERGDREVGGILPGSHRVAEGESVAARATGVGGRPAVVKGQCWCSAGNRHRFIHGEGQCHGMARIKVAIAVGDAGARGRNRCHGGHDGWHRGCSGMGTDGDIERCREGADIACGVHHHAGDGVCAIRQGAGCERPGAAGIGGCGADFGVAVEYQYGAGGCRSSGQRAAGR